MRIMSKPLPNSVQQIADVIGEGPALELVRRWPRTKTNDDSFRPVLYVPARLTTDHRLVAILGWVNAEKLVRVFGGEIIFLATCANLKRDDRDVAIADALKGNATPAAIALTVGLTERRVRQIIARIRAEKPAMGTVARVADHPGTLETAIAA